jgi:hypothetical protein
MKTKTVAAVCDHHQFELDNFPAVIDRRYKE